jgi:hypothetical protein
MTMTTFTQKFRMPNATVSCEPQWGAREETRSNFSEKLFKQNDCNNDPDEHNMNNTQNLPIRREED